MKENERARRRDGQTLVPRRIFGERGILVGLELSYRARCSLSIFAKTSYRFCWIGRRYFFFVFDFER